MNRPDARRREAAGDLVAPTPWPASLALGALGGLAAICAFPPYDMWPLLPVGIAALTLAVLSRRWQVAALASLAWGLAFFVPLTQWAATYAGPEPWLALGVVQALYIIVHGLLARAVLVRRGPGLRAGFVVACLWVGVELLRGTLPWGGLTWGSAAFALADSPLLNLGPWIGTAGLSFVVALLGQLLAGGVLLLLGRRRSGLGPLAGVWPIATVCAAVLVSTVVPLPVNPASHGRSSLNIAGIQGSMGPIDPATLAMPEDAFPNSVATTTAAIERARAQHLHLDLVVWPEDSVGADPREDAYDAAILSDLAQEADAPLLVGTQTAAGARHRYNNAILWTAQGTAPYVYAKRHPVPFGEYVPMRDFFRRLSPLVDMIERDMLPGQAVGVLDVAAPGEGAGTPPVAAPARGAAAPSGTARVGVLICFEIAYDQLVQDTVRSGAEVVVVQSNNALFGRSHESAQQLAEAKVQAVVSGRSVVHVSTVGHSAIFGPDGRRLAFVDHWERGAVMAKVPLRTGITPAVAAGPWIAIALTALGATGWIAAMASDGRAVARPRRRQRDGDRQRRGRAGGTR